MTNESGTSTKMLEVAPYFRVGDVFATAEYYRDVLGFAFDRFYGDPPSFVIVHRDGVRIMLKNAPDAPRRDTAVDLAGMQDAYIWVSDVNVLAAELRERGAELLTDPTDQGIYQGRDMRVRDCDGRILCFGQLLD